MTFPQNAKPRRPVDPADSAAVIDLCNRFCLATDTWDVETMVSLFAEDGAVLHPRGDFRGHEALRRFLDGYRALTIGTRRQALNHVVDGNDDGTITAMFWMQIIRVAEPDDAQGANERALTENHTGFPAIFIHSLVTARFRKVPGIGWRYLEYQVDGVVANHALRRND